MKAVTVPLIFTVVAIFAATIFGGCRAFRRSADKPGPGQRITTTTTVTRTTRTTTIPDANVPEHPEVTPSPARPGRVIGTNSEPAPSATPNVSRAESTPKRPKTSPHAASSKQAEFPTAKLVPGKPGYVFSPFDPKGRYVDVSGYTPGSKVKDPWTDKIFIVP